MPVRCCRVGEEPIDARRASAVEEHHRLTRLAGEGVVAEAMDPLLERRGGGGDGQLEA
jgi:hypothetical protein